MLNACSELLKRLLLKPPLGICCMSKLRNGAAGIRYGVVTSPCCDHKSAGVGNDGFRRKERGPVLFLCPILRICVC